MSRHEWVYLLGLLVPLIVYNLALKVYGVASQPGAGGLGADLSLVKSDIFANLGYALFWIGLFALARRSLARRVVTVLFHAVTILVVVLVTCAHRYFLETGTTLDYGIIAEWAPKFAEILPILTYGIPTIAYVLLAAALLYVTLGPLLLTRAVGVVWGGGAIPTARKTRGATPLLGAVGVLFLALGLGALALTTGTSTLARDPVVNVVLTGFEGSAAERARSGAGGAAIEHPAAGAGLVETARTEKRNVVLVHLESTRAQSTTPYNEDLETTPFLDDLAEESLLVENAYAVLPRSSKASVAVNCGVDPPLFPGPEFEPGGIPVPCLATLLKEQGYGSVFFASTNNTMDNFDNVARGFGYEEIFSSDSMDTTGFQVTNTFGYEDDVMLAPSEEWLNARKAGEAAGGPFIAEYFTGTGHDDYQCLGTRHGTEDFADEEPLNSYLNCMRLQDIFLESLINQYKDLGLYEETVFVVFGDHGEGFGEHGRYLHGDTIYEEGLKVPLLIHDPKRREEGERIEELANQTDVLPTVLDVLGFEVRGGEYPGYSLLRPLPKDRTLMFSCITDRKCLASRKGDEKYVHHYDDLPDEVFDLAVDPEEQNNLAGEREGDDLAARREDLLEWHDAVNAVYGG